MELSLIIRFDLFRTIRPVNKQEEEEEEEEEEGGKEGEEEGEGDSIKSADAHSPYAV